MDVGDGRRRAERIGSLAVAGTILGALEALIAISLGGLIFAGALAPHAGTGIGLALFGAAVVMALFALRSSLPGTVGSVQDVTAAALVVVGSGVAAELGAEHPALVGTVIAAIVATTGLTGLTLWGLGALRLGKLVRFVPYPVIGGFLAGTGWLLVVGGWGILAGPDVVAWQLTTWRGSVSLPVVLPGLVLAAVLLLGSRREVGPGFVTLVCLAALLLFYAAVLLGPGWDRAGEAGWLLGPFPPGGLWPPDAAVLGVIEPAAVLAQAPTILTVVALGAVALLLNATGIELSAAADVDLDRELRVAGTANLVAALGGGLPGFHALSLTSLAHRVGATGRGAGLLGAALVVVTLIVSGDLVGALPRLLAGGLLVFIGGGFLVDWVIDGWSRMPRADHLVVVLIVVVIAAVGFLEGVAVGLLVTVVLFLVTYSRTEVVRHDLRGDAYPARVDRSPTEAARLRELRGSVVILELQGFLFFGTAARLLDRIRARLADAPPPVRFLVLELSQVTGLDSSTVLSFRKAAQLAARHDVTIVLAGLRPRVVAQLDRSGLREAGPFRTHVDLDHAVEWCEDQLLVGLPVEPTSGPVGLGDRLRHELGDPALPDRLTAHLDRQEVPAGTILVHQGAWSRDLYLLESGVLTVVLTDQDGQEHRLRTLLPATVVGEVALYRGAERSASVVAQTDAIVCRLSATALERIEASDPVLATAVHRFLAGHLAERLADTLRSIEALGR